MHFQLRNLGYAATAATRLEIAENMQNPDGS